TAKRRTESNRIAHGMETAAMPRRSQGPWFRNSDQTWRVWYRGECKWLADGPENEEAARRAWHRLMGQEPRREPLRAAPDRAGPLVADLIAAFLQDSARRLNHDEIAPATHQEYARRLGMFLEACGHLEATTIQPRDVLDWLDAHPTWGPTWRHDLITAVKRL